MEQPGHCVNVDGDQEQNTLARLKAIPDNESIPFESQACDQEQGQCEDKIAIYEQLLEKDLSPSKRVEVLYDLVYALYDQGNLEEAIFRAEELLDAYPDYHYLDSVLWLVGKMHSTRANLPEHSENRRQDLEAAERNLRRALEHIDDKEERATVLTELGVALSNSSKLTDAQCAFEEALKIGIEDSATRSSCEQWLGSVYEGLGDISLDKDEYQQAIDSYRAALQLLYLPEKQCDLYYKLGLALQGDEQYERALEFLRQALALELSSQPTNEGYIGAILYQMGQCVYSLRDFQQAVVLLEKATEKVDRATLLVETHLSLGHSYYSLKRFDKAAEFYRKVIGGTKLLSPNWRQAMKYLVWARMAR